MGLRDRFRNNSDKPDSTKAETRPNVIFSVTDTEMAYWHAVKSANGLIANQVKRGQADHMSAEMQAWFLENAGKPVNPEPFGTMWYLDVEPGDVKLVDREMLIATGMDKPENQPGTSLWAMAPAPAAVPEAAQRKARTMALLEQREINTIDHLPTIEVSEETTLRTVDAIADRAVCLMAVALKAEVYNEGDVVEWHPVLLNIIDTFQIADVLTPNEQAFADNMAPAQQTAVQFIWRYEALTVLLWALGYIDELAHPSAICDVPRAVGVIKDQGPTGLKANARIRTVGEILDQADYTYRLHWAVRQAQLGQGPYAPQTDSGVVMERHHALNWLLASRDEAWDNVSTHT